jgi:Na+-driven multidrug efflux pump
MMWRAFRSIAAELVVLGALLAGSAFVGALPNLVERSRLGTAGSADVAVAALFAGVVAVPLGFAQSILAFTVTPIARAAGAGDGRLAGRLAVQNLWLAALIGVAFLALGVSWTPAGRPEDVAFLRYILVGCLPSLLVTAATAWLTAQSAGAAVLAVNGVLSIVQIVWGIAFIPRGRLVAAGEARLYSAVAAAAVALGLLATSREFYRQCAPPDLCPDWRLMGRVLHDGAASAVGAFFASCVPAGFLYLVRWASTDDAAAVGLGFAVYGVAFSGLLGLSQAVQAVTSRRLGEGRPDLVSLIAWAGFLVSIPLSLATAVFLWAAPALVLMLAGGGDGVHPAMAATLPVVFAFLATHVFGHAVWINFAAALRSTNQLRFLSRSNFAFGAILLSGSLLTEWLGGGLPTQLTLLCAYVTGLGVVTLLRFEATTPAAAASLPSISTTGALISTSRRSEAEPR